MTSERLVNNSVILGGLPGISGKLFLYEFQRPVHMGLDGIDRETKDLRHLFVGKSFVPVHLKDQFGLRGEAVDQEGYMSIYFLVHQCAFWSRAALRGHVVELFGQFHVLDPVFSYVVGG